MIKDIIQEGFVLKERGYYKHSIESFYRALALDDSSVELLYEIAECYYLMKNTERALGYIEQVLLKNPAHVMSLRLLKNVFLDKKAWAQAEKAAQNVYYVSKKEKDLVEIFKILIEKKEYQKIFDYNIEKESSETLYYKAYSNFELKNYSDAENIINKVLEHEINNRNLLLKLKILFKTARFDECSNLANKLDLSSANAEIFNFIGLIKQQECDFESAINYFKEAIKTALKKDEYYYNLGSTYFKLGDILQAKKYYNYAISIEPDNPNYHFALANFYYSQKQYKRALEELKYDFFEANLLKSIIFYDSGYYAIAKKELEKLKEEQPENELILCYLEKIKEDLKI